MGKITKIILWIYLILSIIIVYSFDIKIRMLPICAWIWFYSYYDNDSWKCECYRWYVMKNRVCKKSIGFK